MNSRAGWGVWAAAASLCLGACSTVAPAAAPVGPAAVQGPEAYADFLVGRVANLTNDYDAAADRYTAALVRDPQNQDLVNGAVIATLAQGDAQRARRAARYAEGADAPAYARMLRAADAIAASRWGEADTELRAAHGGAAEQFAVHVMQMWVRAGRGRAADIDPEIAPLMSVRPFGAFLSYQQAMVLDCVGRRDDALHVYAAAAGGGFFLPPALERYADLLARGGQRDEARQVLASANQDNPGIDAALARLQAGQNVSTAPLTAARGAAIGLYGLAAIYLQESDTTDGLALITMALILDPNLDQARLSFAQAQSEGDHPARAQAMLHQIDAHSAYAPSAHVMEAWFLVDQQRGDEAIALLRADAANGEIRTKRALAAVYRRLHRYGEAEPLYTEMIAAHPNDWRLYFARGATRESMGNEEAGEADLQQALRLSPDQPEVLNYLGYSWVERGVHLREALGMIQRAVTQMPNSGAIVDSLGWAYYRMGDYQRALDSMEQAVALLPADATLNEHLGDVYWRLGRRTEARFQWRRAMTEAPENAASLQIKLDHGLPPEHPARHTRH